MSFPFRSNLRVFILSMLGLSALVQLPLAVRNEEPAVAVIHLIVAAVFGFAVWVSSRTVAGSLSDEEFVVFSPFGYAFWRVSIAEVERWAFDAHRKEFRFGLRDGTEKRVGQGWIGDADLARLQEGLERLVRRRSGGSGAQ